MPVRRVFVSALWILIVASLVMLPKFVVSRNQDTQMETCDPIVAGGDFVPPYRVSAPTLGACATGFTTIKQWRYWLSFAAE